MRIKRYQPLAIHELGKRANQEDSIYPIVGKATESDRLFLLCDGMGGHEHGEVASQGICKSLSSFCCSMQLLPKAWKISCYLMLWRMPTKNWINWLLREIPVRWEQL